MLVRLRAETLEGYVGSSIVFTLPRLVGTQQHRIDYRHVIWSLVRKPGAFVAYRYRDDLFPTTTFRLAYDRLMSAGIERADRQYVRLLHLAASTSESEVETALLLLLETRTAPTFDAVRDLVHTPHSREALALSSPIWIFPPMTNSSHQGGRMPSTSNRQRDLHTALTQLRLTAIADAFADVALRAAKEGLSHEAYLAELVRLEQEQRTQKRTARMLRASGLPAEKTFRTLSLSRLSPALQLQLERLKSASFLESATNIIAIGKPGAGKSHCLAAVGYALIEAGYPVLWTPTSTLVQRLLAAKRDLRLPQETRQIGEICLRHS